MDTKHLAHEPTITLPISTRNQRIVLEHTAGPYKGLHQITGHSDDFGTDAPTPPVTTEPFEIRPGYRWGVAGLVKSTPRYLLYREIDVSRPVRLQ